MTNNEITALPTDVNVFAPFSFSLVELHLAANNLTALPAQALHGLNSLEVLDLRGNQLTRVDQDAFNSSIDVSLNSYNLDRLRSIDLGLNRLNGESLAAFCPLSESLVDLRLDHNSIDEYDSGDFLCLERLVGLDLCSNPVFLNNQSSGGHGNACNNLTALKQSWSSSQLDKVDEFDSEAGGEEQRERDTTNYDYVQ
jgi:Leucine-rich repeat (LRR) protein